MGNCNWELVARSEYASSYAGESYRASNVLLHMKASLSSNSVLESFQSLVGKDCKNMMML